MAKRVSQAIRKFGTETVMGEGSWVKLRSLTMGEIRKIRKAQADGDYDSVEQMAELIVAQLVDWDWVDNDGNPLPATAEGANQLVLEEATLLATLLVDSDTPESKN